MKILKLRLRLLLQAKEVTKIAEKCRLEVSKDVIGSSGLKLSFAKVDEDAGLLFGCKSKSGVEGMITNLVFESSRSLPMFQEDLQYFPNISAGEASGYAVFGKVFPKLPVQWDEFESDTAFTLLAYNGLGMYYLTSVTDAGNALHGAVKGAVCQIDLSFMGDFKVRDSFERYGCIAYFGEDKMPLAVYWCHGNKLVYPGDADWSHVKYVFRSSLGTAVTVKDHLVQCHWQISNQMMLNSRQTLGRNHPLRRLLKPHTFRSTTVSTLKYCNC